MKTAIRFAQHAWPEHDGWSAWEALLCRCENNEDYCEACIVFLTYKEESVNIKERIAFHQSAQTGQLLRDAAAPEERITLAEHCKREGITETEYYRPFVATGNTPETPSTSRYEADNCTHCHAAYGHKIYCPTINRASAEAASSLNTPSEADVIFAHALGIKL